MEINIDLVVIKMGAEQNGKDAKNAVPPKNVPPKQKSVPNTFLRTMFCWMLPIFYFGNKRDLEDDDLRPPKNMYKSKLLGDALER